jgi:hypothetical protein
LEQGSYVGYKKNHRLTTQSGKKLLTIYLPYTTLPCMFECYEARAGVGYCVGRARVNTTKTSVYEILN